MKKPQPFFQKYKYTVIFILLSLPLPFLIPLAIFQNLLIPRDILTGFFVYLLLLLVLGRKLEVRKANKILIFIITGLASILSPVFLIMLFIFSPEQENHDRVMYEVCLPELRKHYNIKEYEIFPQTPVDKDGYGKWWYQHLECEENVYEGKGPVFSENPPKFIPLDQN